MIAFGIFFAFDWGFAIVDATRGTIKGELGFWASVFQWLAGTGNTGVNQNWWLFFTPSAILSVLWFWVYGLVRNTPAEAGFRNFNTGDESISQAGEQLPTREIFRRILTHPVLKFVCAIEFCSGVMRNGALQWYPKLAEAVGFKKTFFITSNWGTVMLLCGIIGGTLTGWFSDKRFESKRAPMVAILYAVMLASVLGICLTLPTNPQLAGYAILLICTSVIGVHSIKAGTMTADFGGRNAGSTVAIVDGMVYLGTSLQSMAMGWLVPEGAKDPRAWMGWAYLFIPFAILGLGFAIRIWNAKPQASGGAG